MEDIARLWLLTPCHPPVPLYVPATRDIIAVVKRVAHNPAVLARWMD